MMEIYSSKLPNLIVALLWKDKNDCDNVYSVLFSQACDKTPKHIKTKCFNCLCIPLMTSFLANVGVKINKSNEKRVDSLNCFKNPKLDSFVNTVVIMSLGVTLFILVPAGIFNYIEGCSYQTACYYAVVTLSTVGLGNYIAGNIHYHSCDQLRGSNDGKLDYFKDNLMTVNAYWSGIQDFTVPCLLAKNSGNIWYITTVGIMLTDKMPECNAVETYANFCILNMCI